MCKVAVKFLGVRGTTPACEPQYSRYGGDTSCVLVRMGGEVLVLDGGTGIAKLARHMHKEDTRVSILLSHTHLDHIIGLATSPLLYGVGYPCCIYGAEYMGHGVREQIAALMSPPLWPVSTSAFSPKVTYTDITQGSFNIGKVAVSVCSGHHPGGCSIIKLECEGTSIVYATDYEATQQQDAVTERFMHGASLLIIDAQYAPSEKAQYKGYGHSTWQDAAELGIRTKAQLVYLFHHSPTRTDAQLDSAAASLSEYKHIAFAHCDEEIRL